jgi:hypothetical protein
MRFGLIIQVHPYCGDQLHTQSNTTTLYYSPEENAPEAMAASIYLLVRK